MGEITTFPRALNEHFTLCGLPYSTPSFQALLQAFFTCGYWRKDGEEREGKEKRALNLAVERMGWREGGAFCYTSRKKLVEVDEPLLVVVEEEAEREVCGSAASWHIL